MSVASASDATTAPERSRGASDVVKVGFYHIVRTIGQGHSAIVKLANHSITKSDVAIKIIDKRQKDSNLEKIYREIKILKMLKHPNIIKLYQVMDSENLIYIVSEYAPNGEIFDYISNHGKFPEKEAKVKFAQILNAVEYCHQLGIVHRDLKAENLLLDENFNVKLADFGFGNFYSKEEMLSTWCGSPPYAAPEIFEGKTYCGPEVDIWSLGVILYVLVCGRLPFDGENLRAIRDKVVSGRFRIPFYMSIECEQLLKRILVVNPKRRYTVQQIKEHPWMREAALLAANRNFEEEFMDTLVLTGRGISALCHDFVIQKMESAKISKDRVIESLDRQAYDNFTAIYKILKEKVTQKIRQTLPTRLGAAGMRRPSVISEQAMIHPQLQRQQGIMPQQSLNSPISPGEARPPGLAETREAVFSQTTDGVQLHEVAGPFCQMQQLISTSEDAVKMASAAGAPTGQTPGGVIVLPSSPSRPKLARAPKLMIYPHICWSKMPCSRGGMSSQLVEHSIDEGVEIEEEGEVGGAIGAHLVPSVLQANCNSSAVTTSQPTCQPSISIDSNIELDMGGSNLSLSSNATSWSVNSTSSNLPEVVSGAPHYEPTADDDSHSCIPEDLSSFQAGRRASDGLAIKPEMADTRARHLFPKNRACGMAELRKELIKLQNETMDGQSLQAQSAAATGHKPRAMLMDQRSLEETHLAKGSTTTSLSAAVKHCMTNLPPNVCRLVQKRQPPYSRLSHFPTPVEGLRVADYACLGSSHRPISPLRGCPKRQVGPMRSVPLHHLQHHQQNYAQLLLAEHLQGASDCPARGCGIGSFLPTAHSAFASCSSPGEVNQISGAPHHPPSSSTSLGPRLGQSLVPVCHSQGNLVREVLFGSPTRCRTETSPVQSARAVAGSRTRAADLREAEEHEKSQRARRMMFSLAQQQPVSGSEEEMTTMMMISPRDSPESEDVDRS